MNTVELHQELGEIIEANKQRGAARRNLNQVVIPNRSSGPGSPIIRVSASIDGTVRLTCGKRGTSAPKLNALQLHQCRWLVCRQTLTALQLHEELGEIIEEGKGSWLVFDSYVRPVICVTDCRDDTVTLSVLSKGKEQESALLSDERAKEKE
tara:strand:- start:408 stop:863 length:456 start_codon:yes stop_codon:yes gene_type:complete